MKKIYFLTMILLLASCAATDEMEETIFVPDVNDSNLPAYTEWGYNSFGAMYERRYFLATNDIVPCKITYRNGIMAFSLSGRVGSSNMTLYFSFPVNETMRDYTDLLALHQKEIDLTDSACEVSMTTNSGTRRITILSGKLFFQRVQLLRINEKDDRVILSGTFDLSFLQNSLPEALTKGRFDVGIANLFILPD